MNCEDCDNLLAIHFFTDRAVLFLIAVHPVKETKFARDD